MSLTAVYNHPQNGWRPATQLEVGEEYPVESVSMGQACTYIQLAGFSGYFNSVQFDFYEDGKPVDIYSSDRYNPYIRRERTDD